MRENKLIGGRCIMSFFFKWPKACWHSCPGATLPRRARMSWQGSRTPWHSSPGRCDCPWWSGSARPGTRGSAVAPGWTDKVFIIINHGIFLIIWISFTMTILVHYTLDQNYGGTEQYKFYLQKLIIIDFDSTEIKLGYGCTCTSASFRRYLWYCKLVWHRMVTWQQPPGSKTLKQTKTSNLFNPLKSVMLCLYFFTFFVQSNGRNQIRIIYSDLEPTNWFGPRTDLRHGCQIESHD